MRTLVLSFAQRLVLSAGLLTILFAFHTPKSDATPLVDLSWRSVMASVRPLTAIRPDTGEMATICTTTSINKEGGYWLTAAHCVASDIPATFIEDELTTIVTVDERRDLAVLHTETVHVRAIELASNQPRVGDTIHLIGYPEGLSIQYFHGNISSLDTDVDGEHHMMFDMTACQGNSGSAIVDSHDRIVSVLQIGFGQGCSSLTGGALWRDLVTVVGPYAG
jgi:S1-C subfamily serine protease